MNATEKKSTKCQEQFTKLMSGWIESEHELCSAVGDQFFFYRFGSASNFCFSFTCRKRVRACTHVQARVVKMSTRSLSSMQLVPKRIAGRCAMLLSATVSVAASLHVPVLTFWTRGASSCVNMCIECGHRKGARVRQIPCRCHHLRRCQHRLLHHRLLHHHLFLVYQLARKRSPAHQAGFCMIVS